jgi:hypothetical protein
MTGQVGDNGASPWGRPWGWKMWAIYLSLSMGLLIYVMCLILLQI